ncbi:ECM2 (YBR065C) [Zygosaccharomyces parabailii]|uniref:Pre-mRNA-splicing factor SLT11 n=1 Tax=Zygosaccharomyces bailii (strain CLIB 213 / ATCC 58445 / CBS 680 / BCRC 21525 / NBRC 1098 / NCYC 1416 / NRRL Y-2227) TaxID=1333698 RepID=A0A8J2X5N3_ZYGB2|nr:ECM2 (YBR065C) [Zygosaccharomyces parabailii]CDF87909.1 BN860_17216g1_1 [Zygosaccharomyces bailii CLIB 213]CDH17964.1 uncharacterized protein ZBAI_09752 [Zygosaccharomyces bailii ISA1307]
MEVQVCEKCLRDTKHLTKYPQGAECKICTGAFDMYALKQRSSLTKTLICKKCAQQRNICQCCMLDLVWGVPVELRDRLLSLVHDDPSLKTEEAKNEMMRRFLSFKDVKLGGAQITGNKEALEELEPLLALHRSFRLSFKSSHRYLLYNIDPSIPEWQISSSIEDLAGPNSVEALSVNHKAHIAALTLKRDDDKFASSIDKITTSQGLTRGQLTIDRFQVLVVPLIAPIDVNQFSAKVALSLQKLVFAESSRREPQGKHARPPKPGRVTKKSKRARDLEL